MASHTPSQKYLSTRGGSQGLTFEEVVLKGLANDGGLFIPEEIPQIPESWSGIWPNFDFVDLTFSLLSLYISPSEVPPNDLKDIVKRSYSTFRAPVITPVVSLDEDKHLHLLELFHGPTFAFKDVALQFLGNLFEYFLTRRNKGKTGIDREHLSVVGATSGDTGSAAIYGLRGKKDVSIFMLHPKGKISPVQEAQMTTVTDENVHNLALDGTFDDCQDIVKGMFGDEEINTTHALAAVNSINWARILAQITYYFHAYGQVLRSGRYYPGSKIRFVVPTGNFGDILAGYFAKRMGLPIETLVIATNENDILDRFWKTGYYEKEQNHGKEQNGGFTEDGAKAHVEGVKETLSPAMDILVSSNFERLLWFLAYKVYGKGGVEDQRKIASDKVRGWLNDLKDKGGFGVEPAVLNVAREDFESERVSDKETLETIRATYSVKRPAATHEASKGTAGTSSYGGYILDPHTAIGVSAAYRSMERATTPGTHHIALATAHPAKFSSAVELALRDEPAFDFKDLLPEEFIGLEDKPRRMTDVRKSGGLEETKSIVRSRVPARSS